MNTNDNSKEDVHKRIKELLPIIHGLADEIDINGDPFKTTFENAVELLYELSNQVDYFWDYCTAKTYIATFEDRFEKYKQEYIDADRVDFCRDELERLYELVADRELPDGEMERRFAFIYASEFIEERYHIIYNKLNLSHRKKIEFLNKQIIIKDVGQEKLINNETKIKWRGTPLEFITIFNELINQNYIEGFTTQKSKIDTLLKHFEVTTGKGEEVTGKALENYLSEKRSAFNPFDFKLPKSTNNK